MIEDVAILRERIIELRRQVDRQGEIIARLHHDLMQCEAARQKHDRKNIAYKTWEALQTLWGK